MAVAAPVTIRLIAAAAFSVVVTACATPVTIPPPDPLDPACAELSERLPTRVAGQDPRPTTPESVATAAWGDPPISLRCGVPTPAALQPTSALITINGIDWFTQDLEAGTRFTTVGRVANVELTVPAAYEPEADVLVELALPISRAIPPA